MVAVAAKRTSSLAAGEGARGDFMGAVAAKLSGED